MRPTVSRGISIRSCAGYLAKLKKKQKISGRMEVPSDTHPMVKRVNNVEAFNEEGKVRVFAFRN